MRARAVALLSTTALAALGACGLTLVGDPPGATTQDGGTADAASQRPDAGPDAGPTCAALRTADPSVKRCIDFDEPETSAPPTFGFDSITDTSSQIVELAASPLGASGGRGLLLGLSDDVGTRQMQGHFEALAGDAFPAPNRIILDVDIAVDEMSLDYAALATFQVSGAACGIFSGVAMKPDGLRRVHDPDTPSLRPVLLGTPFHVRLIGSPRAGDTTAEELIVDGTSLGVVDIAYGPTCNYVGVLAGTFFTSAERGGIRARFDNIVLRVE